MKEKFNRTYDELYGMYPDAYFLARFSDNSLLGRISSEYREFFVRMEPLVEIIRNEIQDFEFKYRWPFRPDAKYFLITNFNNMIIKPIMYNIFQNDDEVTEGQLKEYIRSDVKLIMITSYENKKEKLISGHDVLKSIDTLWPQLQSTKMELWG